MRRITPALLLFPMLLAAGLAPGASATPVAAYLKQQSFDTDPGWEGQGNAMAPSHCIPTSTSYRYRPGSHEVDPSAPPGEIGGAVRRTLRYNAFGKRLDAPVTFDQPLSADFHLRLVDLPGDQWDHRNGGTALIGFFNAAASRGWRTPQSVAIQLDTAAPGTVTVRLEYGTRSYRAGGAQYQDAAGAPVALNVNQTYAVHLAYDPAGAGGLGEVTLAIDGVGVVGRVALRDGARADGATMDRFGVWGPQSRAGDDALSPFMDDVQIDGGPVETFDTGAPGWTPLGAMGESFLDCDVENRQQFGWNVRDGGPRGAIGGLIWRADYSAAPDGAYYADVLPQALSLEDELDAEGDFWVQQASTDSGLMLGWFRHDVRQDAGRLPAQSVAMSFVGISRLGYFVDPEFHALRADGHREDYTLLAYPEPTGPGWRHFVLHYEPGAPDGPGELALTVDGVTERLAVPLAAKREGASFDRFGIRDLQVGGKSQTVWFDNLTYTYPGTPPAPVANAAPLAAPLTPVLDTAPLAPPAPPAPPARPAVSRSRDARVGQNRTNGKRPRQSRARRARPRRTHRAKHRPRRGREARALRHRRR